MAACSFPKDFNVSKEGTFLIYQDGDWKQANTSSPESIPLEAYESTAREIIAHNEEAVEVEGMLDYVLRFNQAWTIARIVQRTIRAPKRENPIQFSSVHKHFSWLSNFFPTLIFDQENERICGHVEAGYVAYKADTVKDQVLAADVVRTYDPGAVKRMGRHLSTEEDRKSAVKEMQRLVQLKFEQNPKLKEFLLKSDGCKLEEFTSDPFWGTARGTVHTKQSNILGKILMRLRKSLLISVG